MQAIFWLWFLSAPCINLLQGRASSLAFGITGIPYHTGFPYHIGRAGQGEGFHFADSGCGGGTMRLTCTSIHYCVTTSFWWPVFYLTGSFCTAWQLALHNVTFPFLAELPARGAGLRVGWEQNENTVNHKRLLQRVLACMTNVLFIPSPLFSSASAQLISFNEQ